MKKNPTIQKGKTEMKTTENQAAQRPAQEQPSQDTAMVENQLIEERLQQLLDLAKDGDEIAAAELDLYFALA